MCDIKFLTGHKLDLQNIANKHLIYELIYRI